MKTYLNFGGEYLDDAKRYPTKQAAIDEFLDIARELDRFGQRIEASLHYANNKSELAEYPDFILSLGPRGGLKTERT